MIIENTAPRTLYDRITERVVLSVVLSALPVLWLSFVELLGRNVGFYTENAYLKSGLVITVYLALILCIGYAFLKSSGDKYNLVVHRRGTRVLTTLIGSLNATKLQRYHGFVSLLAKPNGDFLCQNLGPIDNIRALLENMRGALSEVFGLSLEQIGLSVVYRLNQSSAWRLIPTSNLENELTVDELTTNQETSAMTVLRTRRATIFFPDKRAAHANRCYVYGPKDHGSGELGSVLCHDISIKHNGTYVSAVLSVTSYEKQLCKPDDLDSRSKIINLLLPTMSNRLKLELALLYISTAMKCSKCES